MSKVITVSRQFMQGHPKAGQPTFFVEKIWKSFSVKALNETFYQCMDDDCKELNKDVSYNVLSDFLNSLNKYANADNDIHPKKHTIRGGKRFKTGDKVSLRVWSDKPYRSKQIIIAPDMILTVKDVEIDKFGLISIDAYRLHYPFNVRLAENDGLTFPDFNDWFSKLPFSGQLLIWNNQNLPY